MLQVPCLTNRTCLGIYFLINPHQEARERGEKGLEKDERGREKKTGRRGTRIEERTVGRLLRAKLAHAASVPSTSFAIGLQTPMLFVSVRWPV